MPNNNQCPQLFTARDLKNYDVSYLNQEKNKWLPARPLSLNNIKTRLKLTWMVFTGKADAVLWE